MRLTIEDKKIQKKIEERKNDPYGNKIKSKCLICDKKFQSIHGLRTHTNIQHKQKLRWSKENTQ